MPPAVGASFSRCGTDAVQQTQLSFALVGSVARGMNAVVTIALMGLPTVATVLCRSASCAESTTMTPRRSRASTSSTLQARNASRFLLRCVARGAFVLASALI